jgi:hypothetical protein
MATGPENYKEAERLLGLPAEDVKATELLLAAAQVYATLALAAATAQNIELVGLEDEQARAWEEAVSDAR